MNLSSSALCSDCGALLKPGAAVCAACLLSAGAATEPVEPTRAGVAMLPCVLGDYRLLRKLGAGGMGIVYEADHVPSGRRLALKVLNQALDNEAQRQRFLREGRLAATIDHPNSVYVFGTDEIEGVPVIAMELAAGGTLRDEVKRRGPLPVSEAVDAILGIIDGLEAAHARGILHRDMKPSNCFLTGEGKAMVGDYGLSISQTNSVADDEPLTRSGMVVGTPAFSPPEQLRAQALDLRADIYSTGGTLYYLLTGKAPVERTTPVETVAAVLEGRVPSVKAARPEVAEDLAAVVSRCLAPQAAGRFGSYAELRAALLPFSSTAAEPAPLGLRFVAGAADSMLFGALYIFAMVVWPPLSVTWAGDEMNGGTAWMYVVGSAVVMALLYAMAETRWGATPGKWLFGLRVAGMDGARPRWQRALARAAMFIAVSSVVEEVVTWVKYDHEELSFTTVAVAALQFSGVFAPLLLFVSALRRPDRAGLHDLATGVRVILQRKGGARLKAADVLPVMSGDAAESWGPFQLGAGVEGGMLRFGHDPLLRRAVLLRARGDDGDGPAAVRRDCGRAGRLRWLQSVTDNDGRVWDVWQAPAGSPLAKVIEQRAPRWNELRDWLDDLAAELSAAEKDGTLPAELSLRQVWITTDGRALLLDEAWPGVVTGAEVFSLREADAEMVAQRFLGQVAELCPVTQRPLHVDALLASLKPGAFERLSHISGNLRHLAQKKTEVSRMSRAATVLGPLVALLGILGLSAYALDAMQKATWEDAFPGLTALPQVLDMERRADGSGKWKNAVLAVQIRTHLAGHYQEMLEDGKMTGETYLEEWELDDLRGILRGEPKPGAPALATADAAVHEAALRYPGVTMMSRIEGSKAAPVMVLLAVMLTGGLQLIHVLAVGRPLLMGLTNVAVVSEKRRPAGRLRMLWRWCVGWSPVWLVLIILWRCQAAGLPVKEKMAEISQVWMVVYVVLLMPKRSLVDRAAGTWLVAR